MIQYTLCHGVARQPLYGLHTVLSSFSLVFFFILVPRVAFVAIPVSTLVATPSLLYTQRDLIQLYPKCNIHKQF